MVVELIAVVLGLLVGLSLGALGGGGSTLAVPILVFVAGLQAQDAVTVSLLVVGVAAATGAVDHYRNGNVRLGAGTAFGAAGIVGSRIGTNVNRSINQQLLLLMFSALILVVAALMYRKTKRSQPTMRSLGLQSDDYRRTTMVATVSRTETHLSAAAVTKLAGAATVVGLLTGLFGVGGGFAVVPALTLLLGFKVKQAIGTSLLVIAINATIALGMRTEDLGFDWGFVVPFLGTVLVGVIVGSRLASRVEADRLTKNFALMLGAVAAYTAISTMFIT